RGPEGNTVDQSGPLDCRSPCGVVASLIPGSSSRKKLRPLGRRRRGRRPHTLNHYHAVGCWQYPTLRSRRMTRVSFRPLWSNICVFLIRIGVSLPSSHNPDNGSLVKERACDIVVQAHVVVVFPLLRETEAGGSICINESRNRSGLFHVEAHMAGESIRD